MIVGAMTYKRLPQDFPDRLRKAGLKVVIVGDWYANGRPASHGEFKPVGSLNHHTGSFDRDGDLADDLAYAKWLFYGEPRAGLPKPLCHMALSVEGTVYLGASGRANHAGDARSSGSVAKGDGNALYVGTEWMLSGTQKIPAKMLAAGAVLNAVVIHTLGSSEQTVSCHYQTSTTGKWDIGDPNGIRFGSAKVLDVTRFRKSVKSEFIRLYRSPAKPGPVPAKPPTPSKPVPTKVPSTLLSFQHTSLQYSDTPAQQKADAEAIFSRGKQHLSGTESGADNANRAAVTAAAEKYGYFLFLGRETWVAVKRDLIKPGTKPTGKFDLVVHSYEGETKHHDLGIAWLTYVHPILGTITFGSCHYMTHGQKLGDPHYVLNQRLGSAIGKWAVDKGAGSNLVFYAGDQNMPDDKVDTFFGSPLTSAQDELRTWPATRVSGSKIDVIASYNADVRVQAKSVKALDDKALPLNTDHYLIEAVYEVANK